MWLQYSKNNAHEIFRRVNSSTNNSHIVPVSTANASY